MPLIAAPTAPSHDPEVCGLYCYDDAPLCPACRAELVRRGLLPAIRPPRQPDAEEEGA